MKMSGNAKVGSTNANSLWLTDYTERSGSAPKKLLNAFKKDIKAATTPYKQPTSKELGRSSLNIRALAQLDTKEIAKLLVECGKIDIETTANILNVLYRMDTKNNVGLLVEGEILKITRSADKGSGKIANSLINKETEVFSKEKEKEEVDELRLYENSPKNIVTNMFDDLIKETSKKATIWDWANRLNGLEQFDGNKTDAIMNELEMRSKSVYDQLFKAREAAKNKAP
jgi:hypothetical protein